MIHETEQDYKLTLQRNHAQRLINENEEQRNLRLQRLRESQSIRKEMELRGQIVVLSSGEMTTVSKSTFDLRSCLVKLKCFKEYNTQIITRLIMDLY